MNCFWNIAHGEPPRFTASIDVADNTIIKPNTVSNDVTARIPQKTLFGAAVVSRREVPTPFLSRTARRRCAGVSEVETFVATVSS
jgi:hypothetical protein